MKFRSVRARLSEQGQALIVMAVMILTFVMFLMFVVGTGLLIHAKINLQNAADLAAYSGAAAQARQLNSISYLNYEMRRQYKKFLFRYYVLGNMAMEGFPGNPSGGGNLKVWSPTGNPAQNYQLPVVCMIYDPANNYCKRQVQPALTIPANPFNTPSQAVLVESIRQLERLRQTGCAGMSAMNQLVLQFWLFSTQPDISGYIAQIQSTGALTPEQTRRYNIIRGVTKGIGLAIKEALLLKRINTLKDYVNAPAQKAMTLQKAQQLKQSADPMLYERSVLAYLSAYKTLGPRIFADTDKISMDELLPEGTETNLLRLEEIKTNFETYHIDFKADRGTTGAVEADCKGQPFQQRVSNIPLGVYKNPESLVYYAVRLRAETKIPGIPFPIELQAYSAAQPFGSRIGPQLTARDFTNTSQSPNAPSGGLGTYSAADRLSLGGVPNLPVEEGDTTQQGWNRIDVLQAYFNVDPRLNRAGSMSSQDMERIYHAAMSPNPYEIGKYNIPNDLNEDAPGEADHQRHFGKGDRYVDFFDDSGTMRIYAPLVSKAKTGNSVDQEMADILSDIGTATVTGASSGGVSRAASQASLDEYLANLRRGEGDPLWTGAKDGFDIATLDDPFRFGSPLTPLNLPRGILISNPGDAQTSWSDVHDKDLRRRGRTGYSVKFVALQHLFHPGGTMTTNRQVPWQNARGLASDPSLDNDILAQPSTVRH